MWIWCMMIYSILCFTQFLKYFLLFVFWSFFADCHQDAMHHLRLLRCLMMINPLFWTTNVSNKTTNLELKLFRNLKLGIEICSFGVMTWNVTSKRYSTSHQKSKRTYISNIRQIVFSKCRSFPVQPDCCLCWTRKKTRWNYTHSNT